MAPPPAAAHQHMTVADHRAAQPEGPWHGYDASYRIMTATGTPHQGHNSTWNIGNTAKPLVNIESRTPWESTSLGCVRPHTVGLQPSSKFP